MNAIVPLSPSNLGGQSLTFGEDCFRVLADRGKVVFIEFYNLSQDIKWFEEFEIMYCQRQHDINVIQILRKASETEYKKYRVPIWIQDEDVPQCCGSSMFFVGQLDDNDICTEAPENAEMWWHDAASFYVFTCPKCLNVKAVGQQC
jgi:hypothetical protein